MGWFKEAPKSVHAQVKKIVDDHYPDLVDAAVTFDLLMAHAKVDDKTGEPVSPALKHHGWPAAAVVKINSHKDRVAGRNDVEITIDGDNWNDRTDPQQVAILDHELRHLIVIRNPAGIVKEDDCGRPKLKLSDHDWQFGGFNSILERHGEHSLEHEFMSNLRHVTQKLFDWAEQVV